MCQNIVIGFLGTQLDSGSTDKRWTRWRPTVALTGHAGQLPVHRLEMLLSSDKHVPLAQQVAQDIALVSPECEVNGHVLQSIDDPWDFTQVYAALHQWAKEFNWRDDCNYFVHLTTGTHVAQICLFLLTESRHFPAKLLETFPPKKAEIAPEDPDFPRGRIEVIDLNLSAYDQLAQRFARESEDSQSLLKSGIATRNAAFNTLIAQIERVALRSSAPMLITGPTGAGKSQLARRIFELRHMRHLVRGPFVEVNCATLRGDNAMSALFGHRKGAFTGAVSDRPGLLKSADGGILFLDEIGTLGLDEQAMLLRAIEDKRFTPLGSDKEVQSQFHLLAGTNENLNLAVREGRFRADLLARINLWSFALPGLCDRREDIEPNIDHEVARCERELGQKVRWSAPARSMYVKFALQHSWPGNFRDLAASVMRMATLAQEGRISEDDVQWEIRHLEEAAGSQSSEGRSAVSLVDWVMVDRTLDPFDRAQMEVVLRTLSACDSLAQAGRILFSESRKLKDKPNDSDRLRKYLAAWGLDFAGVRARLAEGKLSA